jgi:nucleoside recognition membrane protein YjiH
MDFFKVLVSIASGILTLSKLYELFIAKKEGMKKVFFNPLGIGLVISLILTALIFTVPNIHFGECEPVVQKVHDTIYITKIKRDTVYIKSPTKKTFNNKIQEVQTLDEH